MKKIIRLSESNLIGLIKKVINEKSLIIEGGAPSMYPKKAPFRNNEEANKFRAWVNNNYPQEAKKEVLDLSKIGNQPDSYYNSYIQKAWNWVPSGGLFASSGIGATLGDLYTDAMKSSRSTIDPKFDNNYPELKIDYSKVAPESTGINRAKLDEPINYLSPNVNINQINLNSDTLYFVFPGADVSSSSRGFLGFLARSGFISVVLETYEDLLELVKFCNLRSKKFKKIIIGSHGWPGQLLIPEGKRFYFDSSWLKEIKKILEPDGEVHFTACHGADVLAVLKDAADSINTNVYGGKGVGYYGFAHQKGYYTCSPTPINQKDFNDYYVKLNGKVYRRGTEPSVSTIGAFGSGTEPEILTWIRNKPVYSDEFLLKYGYCKKASQPSTIGWLIGNGVVFYQWIVDSGPGSATNAKKAYEKQKQMKGMYEDPKYELNLRQLGSGFGNWLSS